MTGHYRFTLSIILTTAIAVEAVALTELTEGSNSYTVNDKCNEASMDSGQDTKSFKARCVQLTEQLETYKQQSIKSSLETYQSSIKETDEPANTSLTTPFSTTIKVISKGCQDPPCTHTKITVPTGESAKLYCNIPNRNSANFAVAWIHESITDNVVLTSDNSLLSPHRDITLDYDTSNGVYNLILRSITIHDAGNYSCQINGDQKSKIAVDVLVPGNVVQIEPLCAAVLGSKDRNERYFKESNDVVLFCIADGKPKPKVTWHRKNLQKDLNDTRFKDCGQGVARIWNIKVEDSGDYICTAANHLNEAEGDRQVIKLIVKYKPRLKSNSKYRSAIGRQVCMTCYIDAFPAADRVIWFHNNTIISNRQQGVSILIEEKRTKICIKRLQAKYYGDFTCRVANEVGITDAQIVLSGVPTKPNILKSTLSDWPTRYQLRWRAPKRVDGTKHNIIPTNAFIIKYQYIWESWEGQQVISYIKEDSIPMKSSVYQYMIENLHPDWLYKATVTSTNDFGQSEESDPVYFKTAVSTRTSQKDHTSTFPPDTRICPQLGNVASPLPSSRANSHPFTCHLLYSICLVFITLTFGT